MPSARTRVVIYTLTVCIALSVYVGGATDIFITAVHPSASVSRNAWVLLKGFLFLCPLLVFLDETASRACIGPTQDFINDISGGPPRTQDALQLVAFLLLGLFFCAGVALSGILREIWPADPTPLRTMGLVTGFIIGTPLVALTLGLELSACFDEPVSHRLHRPRRE